MLRGRAYIATHSEDGSLLQLQRPMKAPIKGQRKRKRRGGGRSSAGS